MATTTITIAINSDDETSRITGIDTTVPEQAEEFSFGKSYDAGFNTGLGFAKDEILENFDALVSAYERGGKDAVMTVIEQRVAESKRR